jgi:hypothetical protein
MGKLPAGASPSSLHIYNKSDTIVLMEAWKNGDFLKHHSSISVAMYSVFPLQAYPSSPVIKVRESKNLVLGSHLFLHGSFTEAILIIFTTEIIILKRVTLIFINLFQILALTFAYIINFLQEISNMDF